MNGKKTISSAGVLLRTAPIKIACACAFGQWQTNASLIFIAAGLAEGAGRPGRAHNARGMLDGANQSILSVKTHLTDFGIYPASPA